MLRRRRRRRRRRSGRTNKCELKAHSSSKAPLCKATQLFSQGCVFLRSGPSSMGDACRDTFECGAIVFREHFWKRATFPYPVKKVCVALGTCTTLLIKTVNPKTLLNFKVNIQIKVNQSSHHYLSTFRARDAFAFTARSSWVKDWACSRLPLPHPWMQEKQVDPTNVLDLGFHFLKLQMLQMKASGIR